MSPPAPRKLKDAKETEREQCAPVCEAGVVKPMKELPLRGAHREGRRIARKDKSDLWNELNSLSQFARKRYVEERQKILRGKESEEEKEKALDTLDDYYTKIAASPTKIEAQLANECMPNLEKKLEKTRNKYEEGKLQRGRFDREVKAIQADIELARMDVRQLTATREVRALVSKLEYELGYQYIPRKLERTARNYFLELRTSKRSGRERNVLALEALVEQFSEIASSPSKAKDYLGKQGDVIDDDKKNGLEPDGVDKHAMVKCDLAQAGKLVADVAPPDVTYRKGTRYRFHQGEFEAISDSMGSRVIRLIHEDGTQVAFCDGGETRVVNKAGDSAVFRKGALTQVRDREGNVIQYSKGKIVRAMDSTGYTIILDASDKHRFALTDSEGRIIMFEKEHNGFIDRMKAVIEAAGRSGLTDEEAGRFNFESIAARAKECLPIAEARLKEIAGRAEKRPIRRPTDAACIRNMAHKLEKAGALRLAVKPVDVTFQAKMVVDGAERDVSVLSAAGVKELKDAMRRNHPANAFPNLESTLIVSLNECLYPDEGGSERPESYVRVLTVKTGPESYSTILAMHSKMIDAIRRDTPHGDSFKALGKRTYEDLVRELSGQHSFVPFQITWMSNSDVSRYVSNLYGADFLDAMREKDYNSLGRRVAFDAFAHSVTHTYTRPGAREYRDGALQVLGAVTDEDRARADEYIAMRFSSAGPKSLYDEMLDMLMEAYGFEVPKDSKVLALQVANARKDFLRSPTQESYERYLRLDDFRDVVRWQDYVLKDLQDRAAQVKPGKIHPGRFDECRRSFKKVVEQHILEAQASAADECVAIAMQRSRFRARAPPTAFSLSIHLQGIAADVGYEALFNEVCGEATPWEIVRRANQLRDVSRGYRDWPFIATRAKVQRDDELKQTIMDLLEVAANAGKIGTTLAGKP